MKCIITLLIILVVLTPNFVEAKKAFVGIVLGFQISANNEYESGSEFGLFGSWELPIGYFDLLTQSFGARNKNVNIPEEELSFGGARIIYHLPVNKENTLFLDFGLGQVWFTTLYVKDLNNVPNIGVTYRKYKYTKGGTGIVFDIYCSYIHIKNGESYYPHRYNIDLSCFNVGIKYGFNYRSHRE